MAAGLIDLIDHDNYAVKATGKDQYGNTYLLVFPFKRTNPSGENVIYSVVSKLNERSFEISGYHLALSYICKYSGEKLVVTEKSGKVVGEIDAKNIICKTTNSKVNIVHLSKNHIRIRPQIGELPRGSLASILPCSVNQVVTVNFQYRPVAPAERLLIIITALHVFMNEFRYDSLPMSKSLLLNNSMIPAGNRLTFLKKMLEPKMVLLRPYGFLNDQSRVIELLANETYDLMCVAEVLVTDKIVFQQLKRISGEIIYQSKCDRDELYDGKITDFRGDLIVEVEEGQIIGTGQARTETITLTRGNDMGVEFFAFTEDEDAVIGRILKSESNLAILDFHDIHSWEARLGMTFVAIQYMVMEQGVFRGILPTLHHYFYCNR